MPSYSRSHLADHVLLRALTTAVTQDRATTAEMLALIAEVEHRRRERPSLPVANAPRVRPRDPRGTWRRRHGREPAIEVPRAQPTRGRAHVRGGIHGGETERLARRAHLQLSTPASRESRLTPPATTPATRALPGTRAKSSLQ